MRLLIIRHGDPNYEIDSLTERGWKEAKLLSESLIHTKIDYFYCSPLGRAKDTASFTLEKFGKEAKVYDWLQEFPARIDKPDISGDKSIAWDWLPEDWACEPRFFDKDLWKTVPCMMEGHVGELYDEVCRNFDLLLAEHGYVRDGMIYRVEQANDDTLAFFCHYGLGCVLLSHLMNVSPMVLWHGFCAAPTSVSSVYTEERREGKAYFRANCLGDTSHLFVAGEAASKHARFCEMYVNADERHD